MQGFGKCEDAALYALKLFRNVHIAVIDDGRAAEVGDRRNLAAHR